MEVHRPGRRKQPKYYIANQGSESEGESDEQRERDRRYIYSPYHTPSQPSPSLPPVVTTDFPSRYPQDSSSHPSLSSPSSASSHAATESTPPPPTPVSTLPFTSSPPVPIKPSQPVYELNDRYATDPTPPSASRQRFVHPYSRAQSRPPAVDRNPSHRPRTVSPLFVIMLKACLTFA